MTKYANFWTGLVTGFAVLGVVVYLVVGFWSFAHSEGYHDGYLDGYHDASDWARP